MRDNLTQEDERIYLITYKETNKDSFYHGRILVSHGVGNFSLRQYCLPSEPIEHFEGKKYDKEQNEWYMEIL